MKASASCCLLRTLDRSYRRVILHNHEGYSEISTAKRRQYNAVSLATALQDDASSKTAEDRNRCRAKSSSPAWIRRLHNGSVLAVALNYVSQQTPESSETQTKTNKLHLYTSGLDKSLHHLVFSCADNANSGQEFIWAEQECLELGRKGPVFSMLMASSGLLAGCFDRTLRLYKGSQLVQKDENEPSVVTLVDNHTGWVRAIAHKDQICFSAACSVVRYCPLIAPSEHIKTWRIPKGDILALATAGFTSIAHVKDSHEPTAKHACSAVKSQRASFLFAGTNFGAIHALGTCDLAPVLDAHEGRILSLASHKSRLFSAGEDGSIKVWFVARSGPPTCNALKVASVEDERQSRKSGVWSSLKELRLLAVKEAAHDGEKVTVLNVLGDHLLSGGADGRLRCWNARGTRITLVSDTDMCLKVNGGGVRCLSSVLVSKKVGVVAAGMADGTASLHTIFFEKL